MTEEQRNETNTAFDNAITSGKLSANENQDNFAGNFMHMGGDSFKNIITRQYI